MVEDSNIISNDTYVVNSNNETSIPITEIVSTIYGGYRGTQYSNMVKFERDKLIDALNSFKGYKTDINKLKGDIAEYYHSGTFNINATQRGSSNRTYVERSHDYASSDINSNFGKTWQSKYYKTGAESAKQQAKSVFERYNEYKAHGNDSFETFLRKRGYPNERVLNDPIYKGQIRVVPKDQLEEAIKWLEKKILEEEVKRPDQVERYRETLKLLTDRLKDNKGNSSIPLSEKEARRLAELSKKGGVTAEELNLTDLDIIKLNYVIKNAAIVGLEAAAISAGISLVLSVFHKWAFEGKAITDYTEEDWKELFGGTLFSAGAAGISAATLSVVGSYCQSAVPGAGALLMAVFGIAALIPDYVEGKLSADEFLVEAEIVCLDAAIILAGSALGQMTIPLPGLGAVIGAIAAKIAFEIIKYFWGDELRELLNTINKKIEELLNIIKEFCMDIWMDLVRFFKNLIEYIKMLLDKDFNENLRFKYSKVKGEFASKRVYAIESEVRKEHNYENARV